MVLKSKPSTPIQHGLIEVISVNVFAFYASN